MTRAEVSPVLEELKKGRLDLEAELSSALEDGDAERAATLLLAGAANGRSPKHHELLRVLPDLEDVTSLGVLAARSEGDPADLLLTLLARDHMDNERDCFSLLVVADLLAHQPKDARRPALEVELKRRFRRELGQHACEYFRVAQRLLRGEPLAPDAQELVDVVREQRTLPVLELLHEDREVPALPLTQKRVEPKVGRNDPCPCGSGLKYKKCHGLTEAPPLSSRREQLRAMSPELTPEQVRQLAVMDLRRLDLGALRTIPLAETMRRLGDARRWEEAERALEVLSTRKDRPGPLDHYRLDLIYSAVQDGQVAVAERQVARLEDKRLLSASLALQLELLTKESPLVDQLTAAVETGLRETPPALADVAFGLLCRYPALGIVLARGALATVHPAEAEELLYATDDARDRLGLPGGDPGWDVLDALQQERERRRAQKQEARRTDERTQKLAAHAEELRRQLAEASERIRQMEKGLAETRAPATPQTATLDPEERRRLRSKVEELKAQIAESNKERVQLRRSLTELSETMAAAPAEEALPAEEQTDVGEAAEGARPVGLLLPMFDETARHALQRLPLRVSRQAVAKAADLATGDVSAWREAKRLEGLKDLYSARVGIHHRLLFTLSPGMLQVEDVITREGLDAALKRRK